MTTEEPSSRITIDAARAILAGSPFGSWWRLRVDDVGHGWATVSLPWRMELTRPGSILHGACYEVAADVAMWFAVMTMTGPEELAVTIEMKTSFIRSATSTITARAEVLRLGRRFAFGQAVVEDEAGRMVAHTTLTYARADPR